MTQYVINIGTIPNDGTGDPLRTAFNEVNLNFNQVWATGLVGSNITIANNTIQTSNTNGNLILNPNGIGVVQANAQVVPDQTRVRNLGSNTLRWNTVYSQYLNIAGDASITGNLSVTGNIVYIGNLVTDAKTIQLANTAGTANAANGSGITVGANDDIATLLFDSTSNTWTTNIGFSTGNLILVDDRIMDLYGPSITNADLISGSTSGLDIVPNGDANATVLFNTYGNILLQTSNTGSNVKTVTFGYDGNVNFPADINATGNLSGNYILGNGSQLTGINVSTNSISNGASNVEIATANGNVTITANGTHTWEYDTTGNLTLPENSWINTPAGSDANINLHPDGTGTVQIVGSSPVLLNLVGDVGNTLNRIEIDTFGNSNVLGGTFTGTFRRGNLTAPSAVLQGDRLAAFKGRGHNGTSLVAPTGQITIDAYDNWSVGNTPTRLSFWTTNYSNANPVLNMQIDPTGNVSIYNGNINVQGGGYLYGNANTGDGGLYAGVPDFTSLGSNIVAQFAGNVNTYSQINFENVSDGAQASGDFVITADNGDDSNNFINIGITSSTWDGTQPNSLGTDVGVNDGYLYVNGANLVVGTAVTGGNINTWKFDTAGNLNAGGNIVPKTSNVYSLGNSTHQWKDLYVSNATIYMNNVPISLTAGNILTVNGNDVVTTNANGQTSLGNLSVDDNNIYNTNGQGVVISNFSFIAEAETAYVQIPAGNSPSDLSIVQEQGNVRIAANAAAWSFNTNGIATLPDNTNMGTIEGANTFGFYNNNANTDFLIELGPTNVWSFNGATGNLTGPGAVIASNLIASNNFVGTSLVTNLNNFNWSEFITGIATGATTVVTLANNVFGDPWTGQVTITDVTGTVEANGTWWYQAVDSNQFGLYTDNTFTTPVDSTTWGAYISGGFAVTLNYANIAINAQNITIQSDHGDYNNKIWSFNRDGSTRFPQLTVNLHNGGNQAGQVLQFSENQQAIITGPTPAVDSAAQRLIIQGQRGSGLGEGGDVYLWGGDSDVNGGDIKIYAGDADTSGYGGYINLDAGAGVDGGGQLTLTGGQSTNGAGGQITITPGYSGNANGALLSLNGGQGSGDGGGVNITAGYGGANGGQVTITGGGSALGLPGYGNVVVTAGVSSWTFDNTGVLTVPGEGIIQSLNDTVILQSKDTGTGNTFSARLGTNGGLYFETTEYPNGWLSLTNNAGNANITAASGTAGAGGKNINITAGSADQGDYYTTPGGDINITAGLGAFNDGGGGGHGGNVNITAGLSADPAGVAGNVTIGSGTNYWQFLNNGNLYVPGQINGDNNGALVIDGAGYGNGYISLPASSFGGEQIAIVNDFSLGNGIRLQTNGGNLFFDNDGDLSVTGNISTTGNIVAGNLSITGNVVGNITFTGGDILINNATGNGGSDEGGELHFAAATANSTLSGPIAIDIYQNKMRFFETEGNTFGMFIDIANSMGVAGSSLGVPAIGYRDVPQISLSANVTANATNAGKHFYSTTAGNITLTIPDNANVSFPTGATLTIVMNAAGNVIVAQGTGVSLYLAGSSTTGNRVVGAYGLASVMKVATNTWVISGTGVY